MALVRCGRTLTAWSSSVYRFHRLLPASCRSLSDGSAANVSVDNCQTGPLTLDEKLDKLKELPEDVKMHASASQDTFLGRLKARAAAGIVDEPQPAEDNQEGVVLATQFEAGSESRNVYGASTNGDDFSGKFDEGSNDVDRLEDGNERGTLHLGQKRSRFFTGRKFDDNNQDFNEKASKQKSPTEQFDNGATESGKDSQFDSTLHKKRRRFFTARRVSDTGQAVTGEMSQERSHAKQFNNGDLNGSGGLESSSRAHRHEKKTSRRQDRVRGESFDSSGKNFRHQRSTRLRGATGDGSLAMQSDFFGQKGPAQHWKDSSNEGKSSQPHHEEARFDGVVSIRHGEALEIRFNDTATQNKLSPAMSGHLVDVLQQAHSNDRVKAVALTNSGDVFSQAWTRQYSSHEQMSLRRLVSTIIDFEKPIVAGVDGQCSGIFFFLLPFLDIVYTSSKGSFSTGGMGMHGNPSGLSNCGLPWLLGNSLTNEMLFLGRILTPKEAVNHRLVSQMFHSSDEIQQSVKNSVTEIARLPMQAAKVTKKMTRHNYSEALGLNSEQMANLLASWV